MTAPWRGAQTSPRRLKLREAMSGKRFCAFQHLTKRPEEEIWRRQKISLAGGSRERPTVRFHPSRIQSRTPAVVAKSGVIPGSRLLSSFPVGRSPSAKFVAFETARAKAAPLVGPPTCARRILRSDRIPGSRGRPVFVDASS
jgi:hypothetical protein